MTPPVGVLVWAAVDAIAGLGFEQIVVLKPPGQKSQLPV
jgi:hypothetical protein